MPPASTGAIVMGSLCDNGQDEMRAAALAPLEASMLSDLFQPMHLLIIGLVVVVFFGGKKLPELGKGLGEGLKGFKEGLKGVTDDAKSDAHIVTPAPETKETVVK